MEILEKHDESEIFTRKWRKLTQKQLIDCINWKWPVSKMEEINLTVFDLLDRLNEFSPNVQKAIALRAIDRRGVHDVLDHLSEFDPSIHKDIAMKMVGHWYWDFVIYIINQFSWLDHMELIEKFKEVWKLRIAALFLDSFREIDYNKVARYMIDDGDWFAVARNLSKFHGLDSEIISELKEKWYLV